MKKLNNQLTNISNHVIIVNSRPNDMPIWGNVNLFEQHIEKQLYLYNKVISASAKKVRLQLLYYKTLLDSFL